MKIIDSVLLAGIITIAAGLIVAPRRFNRSLKTLVTLTALLALAQLFIGGYYWHYLPAWLLLLLLVAWAFFAGKLSRLQKRVLQIALFFFILAAIVPWAVFVPVPQLSEPQGQYKVGTRVFRWVDPNRAEHLTSDVTDNRNVVVQAWYPAEEGANGPHSSYLDGLGSLPDKIGMLPSFIFDHYDKIETHGVMDAPIGKAQTPWPVILFLTGNGASRAFYTSLAAGLASRGYVVLAIDHPYEAMVTQLADGRLVAPIEAFLDNDPDLLQFMKNRLDLRIADVQFVLDELGNPKGSPDDFLLSLDQKRIGIAGHSLGGATGAAAMAQDSRIRAAVNIDGTLYGELPAPNSPRPFMLLESKKGDAGDFQRYETGNQRLFRQFGGGLRYEIVEADHYSFTDAPLLLALPTRLLVGRLLAFGNIPTRTHHATVDMLAAFFDGALNGKQPDVDSAAGRHRGIVRKPTE